MFFFLLFDRFSLHWNLEFSSFMTKVYLDTTMERSFQSTTESLMSLKTDCLSLIFHFLQGKNYYNLQTVHVVLFLIILYVIGDFFQEEFLCYSFASSALFCSCSA